MPTFFETDHFVTDIDLLAAIFGVIIGAIAGFASEHGFHNAAIAGGVMFIGISLGVSINGTIPVLRRKLRREPWYALIAFLLGGAIGTIP